MEKKRGRPKGSRTIVTAHKARAVFTELLERRVEDVERWLAEVYEQNGPKDALTLLLDMAEYCLPRLARVETTIEVTEDSYESIVERLMKARAPDEPEQPLQH